MKIGIVVEGSNHDAGDVHAVRVLCSRIAFARNITVDAEVFPGGSKPNIIEDAAKHVSSLTDKGFERIVIIWDNCPPWTGDMDEEFIISEARARSAITRAGHPGATVTFVCARRELEAWILTDDSAITDVLRKVGSGPMPSISGSNKPDTISKPKDRLHGWWYERCHRMPTGEEYGLMFEKARLAKLRKSPSFVRFETSVSRDEGNG